MNKRLVLHILGRVLLIASSLIALPVLVALIEHDSGLKPLLIGMAATLGAGLLLSKCMRPHNTNLRSREGFAVVALSWISLGLLGAIPLYLSGHFPGYIDAVFETVSGFTTTGATILTNVEVLPRSILFWRSFMHWIGGMGILVLTMAIIPQLGPRSLHILRAESTGPSPDKLVPRASKSAKTLYALYIALSVLQVIVLLLCGMDLYDAVMHMFSSAGTGGFSNYNTSIGHFASAKIDIVVGIFLILYSLNFTLYYRLLHKDWASVTKNTELKVFFGIVAAAIVLIAINILPIYGNVGTSLRHAFFQVSTIMSTTGFATEDFNLWPRLSQMILLALMVIGGCAGSTAGGIKVLRVIILCKGVGREISSLVHPRSVRVIKLDGHALDEDTIASVSQFFFAYCLFAVGAMLVVSLNGFNFTTTFTSVIACITNTGPGLDIVGPAGNFSQMSALSKLTLTVCMLIGRLDIYPMLIFFTASSWRRN